MSEKKGNSYSAKIFLVTVLAAMFVFLLGAYVVLDDGTSPAPKPENGTSVTTAAPGASVTTASPEGTTAGVQQPTETQKPDNQTTQPSESQQSTSKPSTQSPGGPVVPTVITVSDSNWQMTLLNINYKLPEDYVVQRAVAVEGVNSVELDYRVAPYYKAMYDAAKAEGIYLTPYSGYRRYTTQERNYNNLVNKYVNQGKSRSDAQVLAAQAIMPPGCSEHNMGVAMDICGTDTSFENTKAFAWLNEHAADYGFILRYAKDKRDITGVMYEPWHWRYVGEENAKAIKASGKCLEEYLGQA
ncbi:MAG: hypothetical protein GX051_04475 [Clostridiales bacterium]|nr:hypothetical protein [Clostridiales bacterium]